MSSTVKPLSAIISKLATDHGIEMGRTYVYTKEFPRGCKGAHYQAHRVILDVPSYQWKILMEALNGPDAGLWFCCSPANFLVRYALVDEPPVTSERVADFTDKGKGY